MTDSIFISRNFVEFGSFTPAEIADFKKRSIIVGSDYLRAASAEVWIPASAWTAETATPAAATKAKKAAAKKRTVTKKAA